MCGENSPPERTGSQDSGSHDVRQEGKEPSLRRWRLTQPRAGERAAVRVFGGRVFQAENSTDTRCHKILF